MFWETLPVMTQPFINSLLVVRKNLSGLYAFISFIQKTLFEYHCVVDTMTSHENTSSLSINELTNCWQNKTSYVLFAISKCLERQLIHSIWLIYVCRISESTGTVRQYAKLKLSNLIALTHYSETLGVKANPIWLEKKNDKRFYWSHDMHEIMGNR